MTEWEATEIPASRETRLVLSRMSPVSLEKAGGETVSRLALIACFGSEVSNATRLPVPFQVSFTCSHHLLRHPRLPVQPHRSSRRSLTILTYFQVSFSSSRATLQHRPTRSTGASFEENQPPLLSEAMTPSNGTNNAHHLNFHPVH